MKGVGGCQLGSRRRNITHVADKGDLPIDRLAKAVLLFVMGHQIGGKGTICTETRIVIQTLIGNAFLIASTGFRCHDRYYLQ